MLPRLNEIRRSSANGTPTGLLPPEQEFGRATLPANMRQASNEKLRQQCNSNSDRRATPQEAGHPLLQPLSSSTNEELDFADRVRRRRYREMEGGSNGTYSVYPERDLQTPERTPELSPGHTDSGSSQSSSDREQSSDPSPQIVRRDNSTDSSHSKGRSPRKQLDGAEISRLSASFSPNLVSFENKSSLQPSQSPSVVQYNGEKLKKSTNLVANPALVVNTDPHNPHRSSNVQAKITSNDAPSPVTLSRQAPSASKDHNNATHKVSPRTATPPVLGVSIHATASRKRGDNITNQHTVYGIKTPAEQHAPAPRKKSVAFDIPTPLPPFVIWVGQIPNSWIQVFEHQYDGKRFEEIAAPSPLGGNAAAAKSIIAGASLAPVDEKGSKQVRHSAEELAQSKDADESACRQSTSCDETLKRSQVANGGETTRPKRRHSSWFGIADKLPRLPPDLLELPLEARNCVFNYIMAANPLDLCIWINRTMLTPEQEMIRKDYHISTGDAGNVMDDFELLRSITETIGDRRIWQFYIKNLRCFDCLKDISQERKKVCRPM